MNALMTAPPTTPAASPTASGAQAGTAHDAGASFGAALAEQLGSAPAGGGTTADTAAPGTEQHTEPVAPLVVPSEQIPVPVDAPVSGAAAVAPDAADATDVNAPVPAGDFTQQAQNQPAPPQQAAAPTPTAGAALGTAVPATGSSPTAAAAPFHGVSASIETTGTLGSPATAPPVDPGTGPAVGNVVRASAFATETPAVPTPPPTPAVLPGGGITDPSAPALQPVNATPASAPAAAPHLLEPLNRQLAGPIATLAAGPHGERTMTVNVAPEGLGPVTVKAHLGAEGLRVELMAPTDAGRGALRNLLGDLRRDLAVLGHGSVSLATSDRRDAGPGTGIGQPSATAGQGQQPGSAGQHPGSRATHDQPAGTGLRQPPSDVVPVPDPSPGPTDTTPYPARLDVLA